MIGFIDTLYVHTGRDYRQYNTIPDLHTLQYTVTHALEFSVFTTSRILATDLSQFHCHFKSHMKSSFHGLIAFLPLFCSCQFRILDSIQFLCSHILADWRLETRLSTICSSVEFLFITTLHGHHGKTPYSIVAYCFRGVYRTIA
jgi:hypothetical protein